LAARLAGAFRAMDSSITSLPRSVSLRHPGFAVYHDRQILFGVHSGPARSTN